MDNIVSRVNSKWQCFNIEKRWTLIFTCKCGEKRPRIFHNECQQQHRKRIEKNENFIHINMRILMKKNLLLDTGMVPLITYCDINFLSLSFFPVLWIFFHIFLPLFPHNSRQDIWCTQNVRRTSNVLLSWYIDCLLAKC